MNKFLQTFSAFCFFAASMAGQSYRDIRDNIALQDLRMENPGFNLQTVKGVQANSLLLPEERIFELQSPKIKSTRSYAQRLDSVVFNAYNTFLGMWTAGSKYAYQYDDSGNAIRITVFYGASLNSLHWNIANIRNYTFDAQGNNTQYGYYYWNETDQKWKCVDSSASVFDENHNRIQYTSFSMNDDLELTQSFRLLQTYNADHKVLTEFSLYWDAILDQWVNSSKREYAYDDEGNLIREIFYSWDGDAWIGIFNDEFLFESSGNSQTISYGWNEATHEWDGGSVTAKCEITDDSAGHKTESFYQMDYNTAQLKLNRKYIYEYDTSGNITQEELSQWDDVKKKLVNWSRYIYNFDVAGNRILYSGYTWDENSGQWVNGFKEEYEYDSYGNKILFTMMYGQDAQTGQWVPGTKTEYTCNTDYFREEIMLPVNEPIDCDQFKSELLERSNYFWDPELIQWQNAEKVTYWYSDPNVSSLGTNTIEDLKVYPNPACGFFIVETTHGEHPVLFEMVDLQGKKVISTYIAGKNHLVVTDLPGGIYIYQVYSEEGMKSGRILINLP